VTKAEFENKLAAAPEVDPDGQDRAMIEEAAAQDDGSFISLGAFKSLMGYNGKISLRIPRSLHMKLAEDARQEGVSLNQYALYKLSR
jgi:hypothetical protein